MIDNVRVKCFDEEKGLGGSIDENVAATDRLATGEEHGRTEQLACQRKWKSDESMGKIRHRWS